jgi:hypothetical protein
VFNVVDAVLSDQWARGEDEARSPSLNRRMAFLDLNAKMTLFVNKIRAYGR